VTDGAPAPYSEGMKRALAAALALAAVGLAAAYASAASQTGKVLGGYVQVVAYPDGQVRICPYYGVAIGFGSTSPPDCRSGLPAVGVQIAALPNQSSNPAERWGNLYLVGSYADGTFSVSTQSDQAPAGNPPGPTFATPPCRRPRGGWNLVTPSQAQESAIRAYKRRHPRDITSVAMFHDATIATIASTHPRRTRAALTRIWPKQLCVVRSRYSLAVIWQTRKRLVKLLESPSTAARYGWVNGAGGISCTEEGQPTTPLSVLIESPGLRAVLLRQPRGLVVVDATLYAIAAG
jgi:hypothetical protein